MKKTVFIVVALVAVGGLTWFVWFKPVAHDEEEPKAETEVAVRVGQVTKATLRGYVTAYGVVEPEPPGELPAAGARLAPSVAGVVSAVKGAEGQRVEKGAVLFQLDSRAADVAADRARKVVEFAASNFERQKKLMQVEGTSQKTLLEAEQALAAARNELAAAQTQLNLLQVQAPFTGTLMRVNAKPGEAVDLTTTLAELVDLDRLVVSANVPSAELAALKTGSLPKCSPTSLRRRSAPRCSASARKSRQRPGRHWCG